LEEITKEINKSGIRIANQEILEAPIESIQLYQQQNEHQNDSLLLLFFIMVALLLWLPPFQQ